MPRRLPRLALLAAALVVAGAALAARLPYDESADAKSDIRAALKDAGVARRPVLLIFGANWCEDCRKLDEALKTGRNAALVSRDFRIVKIDVGRFDRNQDVVAAYGDPTGHGIPSAVIVSPDNRILFATRAGELADARHMSDDGIHELFAKAAGIAGAAR